MMSAATPETNGADSEVPPLCSTLEAAVPGKFTHEVYRAGFGVQDATLMSPGASRLIVPPSSVHPLELRLLMLSVSQPVVAKSRASAHFVCDENASWMASP